VQRWQAAAISTGRSFTGMASVIMEWMVGDEVIDGNWIAGSIHPEQHCQSGDGVLGVETV
jgi:hypothetical protein